MSQVGRPIVNPKLRMTPMPPKQPPPMCGPFQKAVQVDQGIFKCVPFYSGLCPPRYMYNDHYLGEPVCIPPDPTKERMKKSGIISRLRRFVLKNPIAQLAMGQPITARGTGMQPRGACPPGQEICGSSMPGDPPICCPTSGGGGGGGSGPDHVQALCDDRGHCVPIWGPFGNPTTALAKVSPSPQSVSQRRTGGSTPRTVPHCPNICPGRIQCKDCTCVDTVNKCQEWTGYTAARGGNPPVLAMGPISARVRNCNTGAIALALNATQPPALNPSCAPGCFYRADLSCCEKAGGTSCDCDTTGKLTAPTAERTGKRRLVPLGAWRQNNPWTTWWGFGPGNWWYRPRSAPAVPWGSYAYYGDVWPWDGVTAPMPRPIPRGAIRRARLMSLANPGPPIFPGPGAHSKFAPLPPQWFYYQQPTTMGAPYEGMIPAAAPGPPPGVFGQGGRCYSDLDCRPGTEYCHGGLCLPKPWSPQENPSKMLSLTQPLAPGMLLR